MIGRTLSSANFLSISQTSARRLSSSASIDCRSIIWSSCGLQVAGVVTFGAAHIVLVEQLVRVIEGSFGDRKTDGVVPANDLGEPNRSVNGVELAIDINL